MIISSDYIFLSLKDKNQQEALKTIAKKAALLNIIDKKNTNLLYDALAEREKISTTGFVDGFAIPHARIDSIKKTSVLVCRFDKGLDWPSHDNKKIKIAIVLLVSEKNAQSDHMDILSKISTLLLDNNFKKKLTELQNTKEIFQLIRNEIKNKESNHETISSSLKKIVAVTGCTVGVAHTYLAAETLKKTAKEMNVDMKVETHGSSGIKNELTSKEILEADSVIIASDINVELSRFNGKKLFQTNSKDAIHNTKKIISESFTSKIFHKISDDSKNEVMGQDKISLMKHVLAGISYMIPFIIFGGLLIALSLGIAKSIYGDSAGSPNGSVLYYMENIGALAFTLMIPILGGFIANSIGGRAAIAPAMIVSFLGNSSNLLYPLGGIVPQSALGFIGAILFGILIGYTVKWINTWRIHKNIQAIMPIFIIPIVVTFFFGSLAIFLIGAPISWVMNEFSKAIKSVFEGNNSANGAIQIGIGIGMGILIGSMAGFDMGGPINKIAFVTCSVLITENILQPMGMMAAAIPVAPLGMGLCTLIFRKYFNPEQKSMGVSSLIMGFIGISEGAIPFAISDPKRAIISNVVGSAVAGAIAGGLGLTGAVAHGGPIVGILGAISSQTFGVGGGIGFFFLAIIIGSLVTTFMYGFLIMSKNKKHLVGLSSKNTQSFSFFNKYKNWNIEQKLKLSNSSLIINIKNHKEIVITSIFAFMTIIGIIAGSILLWKGIDAYYIYNDMIIGGIIIPTPSQYPSLFNYGVFCFIISIVSIISSVMYFPTLRFKLKNNHSI